MDEKLIGQFNYRNVRGLVEREYKFVDQEIKRVSKINAREQEIILVRYLSFLRALQAELHLQAYEVES